MKLVIFLITFWQIRYKSCTKIVQVLRITDKPRIYCEVHESTTAHVHESTDKSRVLNFLNYFKKEWTANGHNRWYEGYSESGIPSQSNAIESIHMHIKVTNDRTTKLLSEFLTSICILHGFCTNGVKFELLLILLTELKK
jgi:hypothetical protein